jgi:hypothetical protein
MRVEVALIQQTLERQDAADPSNLKVDLQSWKRLFEEKYRDRTLIGVFIMFFQRAEFSFKLVNLNLNLLL